MTDQLDGKTRSHLISLGDAVRLLRSRFLTNGAASKRRRLVCVSLDILLGKFLASDGALPNVSQTVNFRETALGYYRVDFYLLKANPLSEAIGKMLLETFPKEFEISEGKLGVHDCYVLTDVLPVKGA